MIGAIIGDIVGSRFEFNNTNRKDFKLFTKDCDFTDDTICTVAVADAILRDVSFKDSLLHWCTKYPNPMGAYGGDSDTLAAIVGSMAEALWGVPEELKAQAFTYLPDEMKEVINQFVKENDVR